MLKPRLCTAALLAALSHPTVGLVQSAAGPVEAQFRGCDAAGWCRFLIELTGASGERLCRVRLNGVAPPSTGSDDSVSLAVRDRLNQLLSDMIHQHKRIVLHDLRSLGEDTFTGTATVNEADVASDPVLLELRERRR